MNGVVLTLAYKYIALMLMLGEVNFFAEKVGLPLGHPVTEQDVRSGSHVSPPKTNDFGGSVITEAYFFGFGWGHLANFHRNDFAPESSTSIRDRNARLAKQPSLVDTNGAYQLAVSWLRSLGVDTALLTKKYKLNIVQWRFLPEGLSQGAVMLPVFQVEWRGSPFPSERRRREMAVVSLTVLGTTKELVEYHVLDDSLFLRPPIKIPIQDELLAIADAEFQGFSAVQRSNLLARCSQVATTNFVRPDAK
jgi:hypothetical protein